MSYTSIQPYIVFYNKFVWGKQTSDILEPITDYNNNNKLFLTESVVIMIVFCWRLVLFKYFIFVYMGKAPPILT